MSNEEEEIAIVICSPWGQHAVDSDKEICHKCECDVAVSKASRHSYPDDALFACVRCGVGELTPETEVIVTPAVERESGIEATPERIAEVTRNMRKLFGGSE